MVQLNVRSAFSHLESTIRLPEYLDELKARGASMAALCETTLTGLPAFVSLCEERDLKPVIGIESVVELEDPLRVLWFAKSTKGLGTLYRIASKETYTADEQLYAIVIPTKQATETERLRREIVQWVGALGKAEVLIGVRAARSTVDRDSRDRYRQVAGEFGIETIPIDPVRFLRRGEHEAYQALRAISESLPFEDVKIEKDAYLKTVAELRDQFTEQELKTASRIAQGIHFELSVQSSPLPQVAPDSNDALRNNASAGLLARGLDSPEASERLEYELGVIGKTGFADYFLIVEDLVRHAKEEGIRVGPGRGSAAGSLVSYALGITEVDPLRYGLLFERFLNPERISLPDIDIDIEDERREEVLDYLVERYGATHVAQIGTLSTLGAKAALRDVARALSFSKDETDAAAKQLKQLTTLSDIESSKEIYRWFSGSEKRRHLLHLAQAIEGLPRQRSVHAAGVVIGSRPLLETTPLDVGNNGRRVTQYLMGALERLGLLKIDLLGLRNLTRLSQMERLIRHVHPDFDVALIPEDDKSTYRLFARGDTDHIFQFESSGMKQTLRDVKPSEFEDLVATMSLFRPGPMKFIDVYAKRKAGLPYQIPHPAIEQILRPTYGVIIYQEQVMEITRKVAGFSLAEADLFRRAISKKNSETLDREREHFISGALANGYPKGDADTLYEQIERFAGYGFNRSHAVAYTKISYALAYIKAHFPQIFILVSTEQPAELVRSLREKRIPVHPPDAWLSSYAASLEGRGVRLGLKTLKGISERDATAIKEAAKEHATIPGLLETLGWGKKERAKIELLLYGGAFDRATHGDRALAEQEVLDYFTVSSSTLLPDELASLGKRPSIVRERREDADWARLERDALGFWLTYSPLSTAKDPGVETKRWHEAEQEAFYLVCYLEEIRKFKTKRGQTMGVPSAATGYSTEEVVVFPQQFAAYGRSLYEGNVLLIEVKPQEREGRRQFVLERLKPLGRDVLFVKLPSRNELALLEQMLEMVPGDVPVVVHYADIAETKSLPEIYAVRPDADLIGRLKAEHGERNVVLKNVKRGV